MRWLWFALIARATRGFIRRLDCVIHIFNMFQPSYIHLYFARNIAASNNQGPHKIRGYWTDICDLLPSPPSPKRLCWERIPSKPPPLLPVYSLAPNMQVSEFRSTAIDCCTERHFKSSTTARNWYYMTIWSRVWGAGECAPNVSRDNFRNSIFVCMWTF